MKFIKPFNSINEGAEFESTYAQKYKPDGYTLIATNESYWGWEYDTDYKYAFLYMSNIGKLILKIVGVHVKSGIGAGKVDNLLFEGNVGTINKPDIKTIQETLKKFSHEKTRAGWPFSRNNWKSTYSDEKILLSDLLKDPRTTRGIKAASLIEDEPLAELPVASPDLKLKKRDKLALLHKNAYKLSEKDLDEFLLKINKLNN
jgi:hypothetical protein